MHVYQTVSLSFYYLSNYSRSLQKVAGGQRITRPFHFPNSVKGLHTLATCRYSLCHSVYLYALSAKVACEG